MTLIIVVGLLIALVALTYWCWQSHLHQTFAKHIDASSGAADDHAYLALHDSERIMNKTPQERFSEARLLDLNLHEGRAIDDPSVLGRVANGYLAIAHDADLDWFEVAQIEHFVARNEMTLDADRRDALLNVRPSKLQQTLANANTIDNHENETSRLDAFENVIKDSIKNTSDVQNVHDSGVNEQLRSTLKRLRETTYPLRDVTSIRREIEKKIMNMPDGDKRARAANALKTIYTKDTHNGTIGAKESEVLALVYSRADMPQNASGAEAMREALLDSLVDMSPSNVSTVCDHGRTARLMESLVLTDSDPELSKGAVNLEQMRNDAFTECHSILQQCIDDACHQSSDPGMVAVGKSYTDGTTLPDPEKERLFKEIVKGKVQTYIDTTYRSKMTKRDHAALLNHCNLAIEGG